MDVGKLLVALFCGLASTLLVFLVYFIGREVVRDGHALKLIVVVLTSIGFTALWYFKWLDS